MGEKTLWEKEKLLVTSNSPLRTVFSKDLYCRHVKTRACFGRVRVFADENLKFDEYGGNFSKRVESTLGKGKIAH